MADEATQETPAPAPAETDAPATATPEPPAETAPPSEAAAPAGQDQRGRGDRRGGDRRGGARRGGARRGGGNRRGPRGPREEDDGLTEKVVFINRSTKVVKGGRRFGFSAIVVVGDKAGKVGLGIGKAREVITSIQKGNEDARRNLAPVSLNEATLPHEVYSVFDGARVLLRPASPGTGIIAGKAVRAVLECAGVRDVLSKSLGSNNPGNVAKAALQALQQLRRADEVFAGRDKG